jgi:HrpA-like RNA helicase
MTVKELERSDALPYEAHRDRIVEKVKQSAVLLVGDTGCGKSTVVPSILSNKICLAPEDKVLCLQTRRIACQTIAD